jgi:hypothetical protein
MYIDDGATVPCREPFEARDNQTGNMFLAKMYYFSPTFRWVVSGPKLNKDGTTHRGGQTGGRRLEPAEVPDYVRQMAVEHYEKLAEQQRQYFLSRAQEVAGVDSPMEGAHHE